MMAMDFDCLCWMGFLVRNWRVWRKEGEKKVWGAAGRGGEMEKLSGVVGGSGPLC